jgi:hypothetical protein
VQHTLETGTEGIEFRHFLASDYGTVWTVTKSARTFAPLTTFSINSLKLLTQTGSQTFLRRDPAETLVVSGFGAFETHVTSCTAAALTSNTTQH